MIAVDQKSAACRQSVSEDEQQRINAEGEDKPHCRLAGKIRSEIARFRSGRNAIYFLLEHFTSLGVQFQYWMSIGIGVEPEVVAAMHEALVGFAQVRRA
jgi:hypothetical protein